MLKTDMAFLEDNPDIERIHVAAQSTRLHILNLLTKNSKLYASKLGEMLNTERKVIAFHLNALEKAGLVNSEFGLSEDERPVAVRYYKLTPKGKEILRKLVSIIER
jgi:predicted transcriptional regulator